MDLREFRLGIRKYTIFCNILNLLKFKSLYILDLIYLNPYYLR